MMLYQNKIMKIFVSTISFLLLFASVSTGQQQRQERLKVPTLSPFTEIKQEVALTEVKLSYARPSAKGRKIFGELVPFGKIWRTGANASTKLTFRQDVKIAGNDLKVGTYALYTIPNKKEWTIIIHKNTKHRSIAGRYKQEEDAFRFAAKPRKLKKHVETFTIQFTDISTDSCYLTLMWEKTAVKFRINFDVFSEVDKQISELLKAEAGMSAFNYFRAAEFYFHNNRDLDQAVEWIKAGIVKSPKNFRFGLLHAKILAKQGKKSDALKIIAEANAWAKERNNANYIQQTQVFWDSIK